MVANATLSADRSIECRGCIRVRLPVHRGAALESPVHRRCIRGTAVHSSVGSSRVGGGRSLRCLVRLNYHSSRLLLSPRAPNSALYSTCFRGCGCRDYRGDACGSCARLLRGLRSVSCLIAVL